MKTTDRTRSRLGNVDFNRARRLGEACVEVHREKAEAEAKRRRFPLTVDDHRGVLMGLPESPTSADWSVFYAECYRSTSSAFVEAFRAMSREYKALAA